MTDHIYKLVEITGTSTTTIEDAIQNAVARASKTVKNLRWIQVVETRGVVQESKVSHWQVTLKIGFTLEDTRE